ncbi:MAG: outer membrane beta-barrel protein [Bacteroidales bacterium]|nr:outer membrane beta-barrel protein [Bacteroidales bacterium]
MQKYIFTLIIILFSVSVFGQKVSFSVVVDPQINWMGTDVKNVTTEGNQFGFNFGLVFDKFFTDNYAFSSGVFLWTTGGGLSFDDSTTISFRSGDEVVPPDSPVTYRLQYLTVPLALKLNSNQIGYFSFFAHLGINNHVTIKKSADVPDLNIERVGIPDEINAFNMSYFIGGGMEYSLGGSTAILAGVYYTKGFLDVTVSKDYKATLGGISLRVGVRF